MSLQNNCVSVTTTEMTTTTTLVAMTTDAEATAASMYHAVSDRTVICDQGTSVNRIGTDKIRLIGQGKAERICIALCMVYKPL